MASSRMIALLGLLAVAGYQNRDKLGELFGKLSAGGAGAAPLPGPGTRQPQATAPDRTGTDAGLGGLLGGLGGLLGGSGQARGGIGGALSELVDSFSRSGHAETAKSWVETGPNRQLSSGQLESALGADTIGSLTRQTGLSQDELLARLQSILPEAVDKMTPEGRLPTPAEDEAMLARMQL
jgi:uncharacterized protein YidB (DUF937 family)